jgi:selenocysteine lyase/cysteine desulfurase
MEAVGQYEGELFGWLDDALRAMRHVQVLGNPEERTPTLSFTVADLSPRQVTAELSRRGICAWDGDYYARELFDALGVNEAGGAVRLGLAHYNTAEEIGYVIDAVAALRLR